MRFNMATKRWYCPTCLIMSDTIWHINQITNLAIWITANLGNNPDAEFCPSFDFEKSFRNLGILQHLKDLKQRGCSAYCAKSVKVCQRRPKVPRKPRVSKIFINAKCGKNAKSVKSEFKVRSWSLSVIVMLQNFQRLVSLLAFQIQRHLLFRRSADFCCSFSGSYFSSMWNSLSDASRLKLKRLRLVLTTKRATSVSLKQQQANL